ncbi:uncharacterized protein [Lolium perenne]|uniref:uncharacterized protein isoform X2 n=1 Tax=Lolium perenne TaxID=4522 RepID=UPI003A9A540E
MVVYIRWRNRQTAHFICSSVQYRCQLSLFPKIFVMCQLPNKLKKFLEERERLMDADTSLNWCEALPFEYQKHMTGMEEDLPALGLERLKKMIKKCQATPCSPQGLGDERDVAVPGGSQCSGASHCYGMGSRRLTRSRTLTGSPSRWRSSLGR